MFGRRTRRVHRRGWRRRQAHDVARQFGDDQHPDTISLWDIAATRLVRVSRNTPVNVCDDAIVAYTVRQAS